MWDMYSKIKKEIQSFDVDKMDSCRLKHLYQLVDIYKDLTQVWLMEVQMEKYNMEIKKMGYKEEYMTPEEYVEDVHKHIKKMFETATPAEKSIMKQKLTVMSQMS